MGEVSSVGAPEIADIDWNEVFDGIEFVRLLYE